MRFRRSGAVEFDLNLAPLVDVMMCLIIFFMLTGRLAQRERVRVDLPQSSAAKHEAAKSPERRVIVNVAGAAGVPEYRVGEQSLSIADLGERLNREAARDPAVSCYIRADRQLEYRHVEPILLLCSRARIGHVTFATAGGRDPEAQ